MGLDTDLWEALLDDYWIGRTSSRHSWLGDAQRDHESDMRNGLPPSEGDAAFPYFDGIPGRFHHRAVSLIQRRMRMYSSYVCEVGRSTAAMR